MESILYQNEFDKGYNYLNCLPIELLSIITSYLIIDKTSRPYKYGGVEYYYNVKDSYDNYHNLLKMLNIINEIPEMVFHFENKVLNIIQTYIYSPTFYQVSRKWIKPRINEDNPAVLMKHVVF